MAWCQRHVTALRIYEAPASSAVCNHGSWRAHPLLHFQPTPGSSHGRNAPTLKRRRNGMGERPAARAHVIDSLYWVARLVLSTVSCAYIRSSPPSSSSRLYFVDGVANVSSNRPRGLILLALSSLCVPPRGTHLRPRSGRRLKSQSRAG